MVNKKLVGWIMGGVIGLSAVGGALAIADNQYNIFGGKATITTNTNTNSEFTELNTKLNEAIANYNQCKAEKDALQTEYNEMESEYNALLADANATTEALVNARKELVQANLDLEAKEEELATKTAEIDLLRQQLEDLQARFDELQEQYSLALLDNDIFVGMLNGTLTSLKIPDSVTTLPREGLITFKTVKQLDLNNVTNLSYYSFKGMIALEHLDLGKITTLDSSRIGVDYNYPFSALKSIYSENLVNLWSSEIGTYMPVLQTVDFSNCTSIYYHASGYINVKSSLQVVKLPDVRTSANGHEVIKGTSTAPLKYFQVGNHLSNSDTYTPKMINAYVQNINFTGTDLMRVGNFYTIEQLEFVENIYVRDDLIELYQADETWSAYLDKIHPVSEMPVGLDTVSEE